MREIALQLEQNVRKVRYGTVSVELHIHDGRIVKAIYTTAKTMVERSRSEKQSEAPA
jgi:hypothetical protein